MKNRYLFVSIIIGGILKMYTINDEIAEYAMILFYEMFMDEEKDLHKLIAKYETKLKGFNFESETVFWDFTFTPENIDRAQENIRKTNRSDIEFVRELINSPFFREFNDIKGKIISVFFEGYQIWRKNTFPSNIKEILPKFTTNKQLMERLTQEYEREIQEIESHEFKGICDVIEEKYQNG